MSVELKASNKDILEEALKRLGISYRRNGEQITIYDTNGTIDISASASANLTYRSEYNKKGLMETLNKIKREYSVVAVNRVAKQRKWVTKWNATKTKATVIRG